MKKIINNILAGRGNLSNGLIALAIVGFIALGCACPKNDDRASNTGSDNPFNSSSTDRDSDSDSDSGLPGDELLNALVKETTADFAYSISEGDFSKMYEKTSQDFKQTYTKDQMQSFFQDFITKKRQVMPILSKATSSDPDFTSEPRLRSEQGLDIMVVEGKYNTKPLPVTFNYEYVKRNGNWRLLVLKVYIR